MQISGIITDVQKGKKKKKKAALQLCLVETLLKKKKLFTLHPFGNCSFPQTLK